MFKKLLIANRGEIAVRVIRACRDLGIRTVAVYSAADRWAPHVRLADEAYGIGPAPAAESYLNIERILAAARRSGAEAVHPGYGFLSENPEFSQACRDAGLVFVGPPPEAMRRLGRKTDGRQVMQAAGVPVVPGTLEPLDQEGALRAARAIGFPVMLKAVAGGGGKGMRVVRSEEELAAAFQRAASEAGAAFGDAAVYVEKLIERPRHVEFQFIADEHGNAVSLGERECSIQRRHQKVVEEAPSPVVTPEQRARMGELVCRAVKLAGYVNAGTAEFLLDDRGGFYFLEVNARLQVEHPVTELVTGLDLVKLQLRVAAGERLALRPEEVRPRGHAIECRIYAEDPENRFLPSTGTIRAAREPAGPGVRIDGIIEPGLEVGIHYDPLLAKLVVWGADRAEAIDRAERALREYLVLGVKTTIGFHRWLLAHPAFRSGAFDTGFVDREWPPGERASAATLRRAALVAALVSHVARKAQVLADGRNASDDSRWRRAARAAALRLS